MLLDLWPLLEEEAIPVGGQRFGRPILRDEGRLPIHVECYITIHPVTAAGRLSIKADSEVSGCLTANGAVPLSATPTIRNMQLRSTRAIPLMVSSSVTVDYSAPPLDPLILDLLLEDWS